MNITKITTAFLLLILSQITQAQNLLDNNNFNIDLGSWTLSGTLTPLWDSFDIDNDSNSGSAFITNIETTSNSDVNVLSQCFPHGSSPYQWGTWVYIPESQAVTGSVVIRYIIRLNSDDCTGGFQAAGGYVYNQTGEWGLLTGNNINYQNIGGSIEYIIAIRKTEDNGQFVAYIDEPYLIPDLIFNDSFE